jgi:PAS domain S-box-containing protein
LGNRLQLSAFALLQHLDDAVIVADESFRVMFWNDAAVELYGISQQQALGCPIDELITIEGSPLSRDDIRQRLAEHGRWRARVMHRSCAGRSLWVDWTVSPFEVDGVRGTIAVTKDVDLQRRAEEALCESAERFRCVFTQGPEPSLLIDKNILDCNSAACDFLGYDLRGLVGRPPLDLLPEFQADGIASWEHLRTIQDALRSGQTQRFALQVLRSDGCQVQAHVAARAAFYHKKRLVVACLQRVCHNANACDSRSTPQ